MSNNIYRKTKPKKCPRCGFKPMASVQYGYPIYSSQMEADIKTGKIFNAGCMEGEQNPKWRCSQCGLFIYRSVAPLLFDEPPFRMVKPINLIHISELIAARLNHHPNAISITVSSFRPFLFNESSWQEVEEYATNPDMVCIEYSIKGETKIGASDVAFIDLRKSEVVRFDSIGE